MNYFSSGKGAGKKSGKSVVFFQKTLGPPRRWSLLLSFWYHTDDNRLLQSEIYAIASLESFGSKQCGPHWPRRGPKRDEKDRRWSWWFLSLLGDHIHPIIVQKSGGEGILRKCAVSTQQSEKPFLPGRKRFLMWFFLGFGGKFVLKSVFVILKLWTEVPFLRCHVLRVFAIFWHLKTGTRDIRDFRQSILKDPQNGRSQNPSNTFTFWFE